MCVFVCVCVCVCARARACVHVGMRLFAGVLHSSVLIQHECTENPINKHITLFPDKATAQARNNMKARMPNAGPLARSQFASGSPCDRPTRSKFSCCLPWSQRKCSVGNTTMRASHAIFPWAATKFRPNVVLQMSD
jgi:hypothetical protein